MSKEFKVALERSRSGRANVIPIILRPCLWKNLEIAQLNVLPSEGIPLSQSADRDQSLMEVTEQIRIVSEAIAAQRRRGDFPSEFERKKFENEVYRSNIIIGGSVPYFKKLRRLAHPSHVVDAAFSRDKYSVATVCFDGKVRIFDMINYDIRSVCQAKPRSLTSVSWSRSNQEIATGDTMGFVRFWRDQSEVFCLSTSGVPVRSAEYNMQGDELVAGSDDGVVRCWKIRKKRLRWESHAHSGAIRSVRFSYSDEMIAVASEDGTATIIDSRMGIVISRFEGHSGKVYAVEFCNKLPTSQIECISAGEDGKVFRWGAAEISRPVLLAEHSFWATALACAIEQQIFITGGYDAAIKVGDLSTGEVYDDEPVESGPIYCTRFTPDGELLIVSSDDCLAHLFRMKRDL